MADEADITADRMEREEALRRKLKPVEEIKATGFCHYCEEPIQLPYKFCPGGDCSADWEWEQKLRRGK